MSKNLNAAKAAKNDEFYTQLPDIERELKHYKAAFKGKTVYCNCDDPVSSAFFQYFALNFEHLGLKRLVATSYRRGERGTWFEYDGDQNGNRIPDPAEIETTLLDGDGDFRSPECIALLKQADIVVTNPPFSLFREYVAQLVEHDKKFLIIGNINAITYKEIFPLIKADRLWLGSCPSTMEFMVPDHYEPRATRYWQDADGQKWRSLGNGCWFTNLDTPKRHESLILYRTYYGHEEDYPTYDNYDAIEVGQTKDIPDDYYGTMGVPITFLDKYNPGQFEIVGDERSLGIDRGRGYVAGRRLYSRIFIKRRN